MEQRHGIAELHQHEMTHRCAVAQSRLDHIYLNQDIVEQIDRELPVEALDWTSLSHHRAVMSACKIPEKLENAHWPIT